MAARALGAAASAQPVSGAERLLKPGDPLPEGFIWSQDDEDETIDR